MKLSSEKLNVPALVMATLASAPISEFGGTEVENSFSPQPTPSEPPT